MSVEFLLVFLFFPTISGVGTWVVSFLGSCAFFFFLMFQFDRWLVAGNWGGVNVVFLFSPTLCGCGRWEVVSAGCILKKFLGSLIRTGMLQVVGGYLKI